MQLWWSFETLRLAGAADALVTAYESRLFYAPGVFRAPYYYWILRRIRNGSRGWKRTSFCSPAMKKNILMRRFVLLGGLLPKERREDNKSHALLRLDPQQVLLTGHAGMWQPWRKLGVRRISGEKRQNIHSNCSVYKGCCVTWQIWRTYRELCFRSVLNGMRAGRG